MYIFYDRNRKDTRSITAKNNGEDQIGRAQTETTRFKKHENPQKITQKQEKGFHHEEIAWYEKRLLPRRTR